MANNPGPFGTSAMSLYAHGLMPIPCSADDDGKVPGVRWSQWTRRPGEQTLARLAERFQAENVGVITGLSNVVVVDVDDPGMSTKDVVRQFGNTPMITKTPSGGRHHWYRATNERCFNLRTQGLPVDIKGRGGFIVVPPSIRPAGVHAGKRYEFLDGGWADLDRLPPLKPGALPESPAISPPTTREGQRNGRLFKILLRHARACDGLDALLDVAGYINEGFVPSLSRAEVVKTAASAWNYELRGCNFAGGDSGVFVARAAIDALVKHRRGADALTLLVILRANHSGLRREFAVAPRAMTRSQTILGWQHERYRDAIGVLVALDMLVVRHIGGHGPGDPTLYTFGAFAQTAATPEGGGGVG